MSTLRPRGVLAVATLLILATAPGAFAGGADTVTVVARQIDVNPGETNTCTGATGTIVDDEQDVFHITDFGGGIFHLVDTQTGTLTFTPDDPSALTLTGHYTTTFSDQSNPPGLQFTVGGPFDVVAVGADGSRVVFHLISRTTRTPDGTVTVLFNVTRFECVPPAA